MNLVVGKIHERDSQKAWTKTLEFYTMICQIGTQGRFETEYLLESSDVVVDLVDLMLQ